MLALTNLLILVYEWLSMVKGYVMALDRSKGKSTQKSAAKVVHKGKQKVTSYVRNVTWRQCANPVVAKVIY